MKTKFNVLPNKDNWKLAKNHCRTTVKKEHSEKDATGNFKKKLLISEHSPIRILTFDWTWNGIKYWVSTEWSRHKFEKFITSQRNDRQKDYDRNKAPQDSLVNFDGNANMQNLIDSFRKRLCFMATKEARELAEDFKSELSKTNREESDILVPNCIYRCGCPEFKACGFFDKFISWCRTNYPNCDLSDIQTRYNLYNEYFYKHKDIQ